MNEFDQWNKIKQETNKKDRVIGIKNREIFYLKLGQNIGYEQNGKGKDFIRPVLILKRLTKDMFIGIPLTTKIKDSSFFYKFTFNHKTRGNIQNSAIIAQIKMFSTKRILNRIGMINQNDFEIIKTKVKKLIG